MDKLKMLELFGGIGAPRKALERSGIDVDVVDYVEIDKYAVASYNEIFNENYIPQDVSEWDKDLDVDLIFHGSPCQDFSLAGKGNGGEKDSGTRSSLMWESVRIVEKIKPKIVIWENVKAVTFKTQIKTFEKYLSHLESLGYKNKWKVLNTKHYGIPQNRNRIYVISILNENRFNFPDSIELDSILSDYLEDNVNEKYYLSDAMLNYIFSFDKNNKTNGSGTYNVSKNNLKINRDIAVPITAREGNTRADTSNYILMPENTKRGCKEAYAGDGVYINRPHQKRGVVQTNKIATIKTSMDIGVVTKDMRIRKLTPKECFRLQGFDDIDFERASKVCSNTQLYKQAGNSITVNVLEHIFKNLFKERINND